MSQNIFFQEQNPDLQFQSFSYGQPTTTMNNPNPYNSGLGYSSGNQMPLTTSSSSIPYGQSNQMGSSSSYVPPPAPVSWRSIRTAFSTGDDPSEPPLLHELGINFGHIKSKSFTVMNPFKPVDKHIMDDTDLAGPLFFCLLFGSFLMLSGKLQFGFIYGVAVLGCLSMYTILNLMSQSGIDIYRTASVLGYCLLPMVFLSSLASLLALSGSLALTFSALSVLWCTYSASLMFVTVLSMNEQRILVAYPVALLYSAFAILAVF